MSLPPRPVVSGRGRTLVDPDKALRAATIAAVRRLEAAGIGFTIISARPRSGLGWLADELAIDAPIGAFNGGTVFRRDGSIDAQFRVPVEVVKDALAMAAESPVAIWVFADDRWDASSGEGTHVEHERKASAQEPVVTQDFAALVDKVDKITLVSDDADLLRGLHERTNEAHGEAATIAQSQTYYLDVTALAANKGDGVATLAKAFGVPLEQVAVLGDQANDLPMLRRAGLPIVMANAPDAVRVAFDLDGTLAESKQPLGEPMGEALADLLDVAHVAVISGGDWPQFDKQVASRLPERADRSKLWLMPTTGTKLYTYKDGSWTPVYAELFDDATKAKILEAFDASLEATGFVPEQTWGERIEDRGSQITFSALGQQAPIDAKEHWDPKFEKRKVIQADLKQRLPGLSINMGGATSIDITREGVDKAYGLKKLRDASGIELDAMMFIGDAIFPGGNDYPAKELGLDTVRVRDPEETLAVIAGIVACLK